MDTELALELLATYWEARFCSVPMVTLTAGADTPATTEGNDVINALTIDASGTAATTFSAFDNIDGKGGNDTLNIYTNDTHNAAFPTSFTVKNVETVNILNGGTAAAALGDASKFEGVTQLWQNTLATGVTNLAATTTAGFKNVDANVSVAPAATAASVAVALDNYGEGRTIAVNGSAATATLASVTVSGTVKDTSADGTVATTTLNINTGKDVETLTVTTAVGTTLSVTDNAASAATKEVRTIDASASTGGINFGGTVTGGAAGALATIKTGSGADAVTIATATLKDDAATTADETRSALLETGAGNDTITVSTTGTGTTTVNAGEGNDTVELTTPAGEGVLTVNLGAGNDSFTVSGTGAVSGTDIIDGGEGVDTLQLVAVGVANIAAFSNFELFDAKGLGKTLDVEILAAKNTVTEFIASGAVGANAALTNVGAGVGIRATKDALTDVLVVTQKAAGALTVTLDADSTATTANATNIQVDATNATSLKAVFDVSSAHTTATANVQTITLDDAAALGQKATSLEIVSGGANASNVLEYSIGEGATAGTGALTTVTISGDQALNISGLSFEAGATINALTTVNASALTGALTADLVDLKASTANFEAEGGVLTLGAGDDVITGANWGIISSFQRGTAEDAAKQEKFDVVKVGTAVQATDVAATPTHTVKDGLLTFNGTGPATLEAAIALANTAAATPDTAVAFEYIGNSYVFVQATADVVIKLAGVTGLTGLDNITGAAGDLYVF